MTDEQPPRGNVHAINTEKMDPRAALLELANTEGIEGFVIIARNKKGALPAFDMRWIAMSDFDIAYSVQLLQHEYWRSMGWIPEKVEDLY